MDNQTIAQRLLAYANYLEAREANLYRARAYRRAADTLLTLNRPAADIVAERGRDGLEELPGIGAHLSYTIEGLVRDGKFRTQDREGGNIDVERLFGSLPGVGPRLARQIHEQLGIETLEQLEQAAYEGRLEALHVGSKRLRGIREALETRLRKQRFPARDQREPSVAELLAVDADYRAEASRQNLPTLTPRRFNPRHDPWLPLFQGNAGPWHYRALFSNTALAHRLGRTRDWVVIYFHDNISSGQRTVVTETRGELAGRRVVRGREHECLEHYRAQRGTGQPQLRGA
jgi:hypothetical protein